MKNIYIIILLLMVKPLYLAAQSPATIKQPELNADRPDRSQGPQVLPQGTLQIETGYEFQKDRSSSFDRKEYLYPNMLLRIGLLSWAELRVTADYKKEREHIFSDIREPQLDEDKGFNDVRIGAKIKLYKGKGLIPQIGILGRITLPVGDKDFRPPHVAPSGSLLFSHELSDKVELQYNIGYEKQRDQDEYRGQTLYALNTTVDLADKVKAYVEVFGQKPHHDQFEHQADGGLLFLLLPNLQVDIYGGMGLNEAAPNYFAGGGFTWRLPR